MRYLIYSSKNGDGYFKKERNRSLARKRDIKARERKPSSQTNYNDVKDDVRVIGLNEAQIKEMKKQGTEIRKLAAKFSKTLDKFL